MVATMKVERISYKHHGANRLFYIASSTTVSTVVANCFTAGNGKEVLEFKNLEFEVWDLNYEFKHIGKYCFVIFEDGLKTVILIVTIV